MAEESGPSEAVIARARSERFGALPPRIHPGDQVELVETRRLDARPATALSLEQERALHTAA
ncbi:hypothetical protein [Actinoplanes utahensis]|uniref:Uncharacterized protein n=1 Tax=Actinoplanes utahensis TaxID=1869 RepID=A0A0A6UH63_ACTUT|nr:hypothetical protein [Actinoplanes utahensis]KHD74423.1 hypothetical protein MB27_28785 [Actinoplanes utahensis]GIF34386.1 hypothetical protein Aut01nite_73720 [Actinoplanes utahensis]